MQGVCLASLKTKKVSPFQSQNRCSEIFQFEVTQINFEHDQVSLTLLELFVSKSHEFIMIWNRASSLQSGT